MKSPIALLLQRLRSYTNHPLLLALVFFLASGPLWAQPPRPGMKMHRPDTLATEHPRVSATMLELTGTGKMRVKPDVLELSLGLEAYRPTMEACVKELDKQVEQLTAHLVKSGISPDRIKTQGYSVGKHRAYNRDRSFDSGYVARQYLVVTDNSDKQGIGRILNALAKSPVNASANFGFRFSDEKEKELEQELIRLAMKDARSLAQVIASEENLSVKKIQRIIYGEPMSRPMYRQEGMMYAMAKDGGSGELEGFNIQDQLLTKSIQIVFILGN